MKINYRPEIDGLRAIAVSAVIFYHARIIIQGYQPFRGGFIGVDIFFVISGYLITSIILRELIDTGTFSFRYFYERRIRRILPALLSVMLFSLPIAWFYKLPFNLVEYSKSIIYSLGFSSNFFFHFAGQQYGNEDGLTKPFLHTWSLSVEEQFYIIFPIFLFFIFRYQKKNLINFLFIFLILSLFLAQLGSKNFSSLNFYYLPSRGWEILAGSILAYYEIKFNGRSKNRLLNNTMPIIGLIMIFYSFLFFNKELNHPSLITLIPIIGTCLIIWFADKNEIITIILSSKLFVGVGLISYSLYLWHYPIFAYVKYINLLEHSDIFLRLLIGFFIVLISVASYYFIERPFRNKSYKFKKLIKIIITMIVLIFSINSIIIYNDGFKNRFSEIYLKNNFFRSELSDESLKYVEKYKNKEFVSKNKEKILIVGDSHSIDLFNSFIQNKQLFKQFEFLRYNLSLSKKFNKDEFKNFSESKVYSQADTILISDYFSDTESFLLLEDFLKTFNAKKKIILTSNNTLYRDKLLYKKYSNLTLFDYFLIKDKNLIKHIDDNLSEVEISLINKYYFNNRRVGEINLINNRLKEISKDYDIKILLKEDFQCNVKEKLCYGSTGNGFKIYYDYAHFTLEGAKFLGKKIHELNWFKTN